VGEGILGGPGRRGRSSSGAPRGGGVLQGGDGSFPKIASLVIVEHGIRSAVGGGRRVAIDEDLPSGREYGFEKARGRKPWLAGVVGQGGGWRKPKERVGQSQRARVARRGDPSRLLELGFGNSRRWRCGVEKMLAGGRRGHGCGKSRQGTPMGLGMFIEEWPEASHAISTAELEKMCPRRSREPRLIEDGSLMSICSDGQRDGAGGTFLAKKTSRKIRVLPGSGIFGDPGRFMER